MTSLRKRNPAREGDAGAHLVARDLTRRARLVKARSAFRASAALGVAALFGAGALSRLGTTGDALLVLGVLGAAAGVVGWLVCSAQLRPKGDPWAFDPELDGPRNQFEQDSPSRVEHLEDEARRRP